MFSITISDVLKVAAYRISVAVFYFSSEADKCYNKKKQNFLRSLVRKKQTQKVVLDQISKHLSLEKPLNTYIDFSDYNCIFINPIPLNTLSLKEIYTFIYQHAIEEIEFYISLIPLTSDTNIRHIINTLIDLSRNFSQSARIGYLTAVAEQTQTIVFEEDEQTVMPKETITFK